MHAPGIFRRGTYELGRFSVTFRSALSWTFRVIQCVGHFETCASNDPSGELGHNEVKVAHMWVINVPASHISLPFALRPIFLSLGPF